MEPTGPETLNLHLAQDPTSYFYLQQSTDLGHFTPFSMVLGESSNDWNLYLDPETPSRYFRSRGISLFAPEDTDHDGLDDLYELRHPVLNPLDPTDGALDPDNNSLTFLDEYRLQYNLGNGKREAVSDEVSTFTTRPFTGPASEALSDEVSIFTTRPFTGPVAEALSEEVSVFTIRPFDGPAAEAMSEEVSVFTFRPFNGPAVEALSEEVSIFTTRLFAGPIHEAISDEVSLQKFLPLP